MTSTLVIFGGFGGSITIPQMDQNQLEHCKSPTYTVPVARRSNTRAMERRSVGSTPHSMSRSTERRNVCITIFAGPKGGGSGYSSRWRELTGIAACAGSARNLHGEILIPVGGVACLGGLSYAERHRLVPFGGERRGIHYQEQARTESAPCQSECDRCGSGAADQCRQLTRGDNPVRRNGTLNRQRDDRGGEAFLIVLDEEPVGILVLRHELGTGRIPRHCGAVIPQPVQILRPVSEHRLPQCRNGA